MISYKNSDSDISDMIKAAKAIVKDGWILETLDTNSRIGEGVVDFTITLKICGIIDKEEDTALKDKNGVCAVSESEKEAMLQKEWQDYINRIDAENLAYNRKTVMVEAIKILEKAKEDIKEIKNGYDEFTIREKYFGEKGYIENLKSTLKDKIVYDEEKIIPKTFKILEKKIIKLIHDKHLEYLYNMPFVDGVPQVKDGFVSEKIVTQEEIDFCKKYHGAEKIFLPLSLTIPVYPDNTFKTEKYDKWWFSANLEAEK
jgi:hypothetical protein